MPLPLITSGHLSRHNGNPIATKRELFRSIKYFISKPKNSPKIYCYKNNTKNITDGMAIWNTER